jgi:hypothetical protein
MVALSKYLDIALMFHHLCQGRVLLPLRVALSCSIAAPLPCAWIMLASRCLCVGDVGKRGAKAMSRPATNTCDASLRTQPRIESVPFVARTLPFCAWMLHTCASCAQLCSGSTRPERVCMSLLRVPELFQPVQAHLSRGGTLDGSVAGLAGMSDAEAAAVEPAVDLARTYWTMPEAREALWRYAVHCLSTDYRLFVNSALRFALSKM